MHTKHAVNFMLEHLCALREDKDLSQKDMAELLKVHQTSYSDYERGNVNIPISALKQLAEYFNTSVDYMIGLTDVDKPYPRK